MTMKNEKDTRIEYIDKQLAKAGWNVSDFSQVVKEYRLKIDVESIASEPNAVYGKQGICDYVLLGKNGKPVAVVEAKKTSKDAGTGREQAKQYCYSIAKEVGYLPFCFYTNGYVIYFWDLENYPPRKVYGFPTLDDFERLLHLRNARKSLAEELINTKIAGRGYQLQAIRAITEAIEKKERKFLLVMATGTGKTRTCIALVDTLMRAGWGEKILFLVDRVALHDQAIQAFKEHLPNEPRWGSHDEPVFAKDRRIYVGIYQTMLNLIRENPNYVSPHFFDLIIIDESHRSIYNTYQEVIDYFNSITLGLTATPTDVIDHNTFHLFLCQDQLPTYAFSYEEALKNTPPYLCNFQVMKIKTKFQELGINKRTVSLEDQKKLLFEGKEIEEINYEGSELERTVSNKGTNALIVKEFMEECIKDKNGVLPGKTIFFCVGKSHAREMEKIFDSLYPEYKGELAKVLVSEDPRVYGKGGLLDQFTNQDFPRIALSVDMLDTGIDIREIVNLVFAKPVYSYTKFWQMIGRGTRLLEKEKLKTWCTEKDVFLILDCWDNFEYFKLNPKGKELKPQIPLPVRLFGLRIDKIEIALENQLHDIVKNESLKLVRQITQLPRNSIVVLDALSDLNELAKDDYWTTLNKEKFDFLRKKIKPLMRAMNDVDFKAMRFEKDIVEVSLAHISKNHAKFETLKASIIEEIKELPLSVNIVAREQDLIKAAQTNHFWATISEEKFDDLIEKLSPLMKYLDTVVIPEGFERLNFEDELYEKEFVEFGSEHASLGITKYKELLEDKIKQLMERNPILQKLISSKKLTDKEIETLAEELHNEYPHVTLDILRKVYRNRKAQFIQFIKHILNIEILETYADSVSKAFDKYTSEHSYLSGKQLEFIVLLKNFIIEKGKIEKRDLIKAPFTLIHPHGIQGVFNPNEIAEILNFINNFAA